MDTLGVFLPSKTLLMVSGFLVGQGHLQHQLLFLAALSGSLTGFLVGYLIGAKAGRPILDKFVSRFCSREKISRAEDWFSRYGTVAIVVAYFIPGARHITPYLAGIAGMPSGRVMLCALTGASLWVLTFTTIGRVLGDNWPAITGVVGDYILEVAGGLTLVILLIWWYKRSCKLP